MNGSADPGRGVLILVLGILSIVFCFVAGPFAWVMGSRDLRRIAAGEISIEARPLTQAGMVCGIIGTAIAGLGLVAGLVWLLAAVGFAVAAG